MTRIEGAHHNHIRPSGGYCEPYGSNTPSNLEEALAMVNELLDQWTWDSGRKFDDPPLLPGIIETPNPFPPTLCNNIEFLYDTARKYDIRIPPEYATFSYDSGGYYDILPYLQKCFMELLKNHPDPDGGTCDYIDYQIGMFFHDMVGSNILHFWDEGGSFDDPKYISTVLATKEHLSQEGLMYRYKNQDDFGLPSSSFTICVSFLFSDRISSANKQF